MAEEGVVDLMERVVASGHVDVTPNVAHVGRASGLPLICEGTEPAANGNYGQSAMLAVAAKIGRALRDKTDVHVIVFRSMLVPGTVEDTLRPIIEREWKREVVDFRVCFQPEFLREGTLTFGSESKSLPAHCDFSCEVDPFAIEEYFALGYVPEPRTIFPASRSCCLRTC